MNRKRNDYIQNTKYVPASSLHIVGSWTAVLPVTVPQSYISQEAKAEQMSSEMRTSPRIHVRERVRRVQD